MISVTPFLIVLGLALFILRMQLLWIALQSLGKDKVHPSPALGAASGWASLVGVVLLCLLAPLVAGGIRGILVILAGLALGVVGSAMFISVVGKTSLFGHYSGEGNTSVAVFTQRYGHWLAFAVLGIALVCLWSAITFLMSFRV